MRLEENEIPDHVKDEMDVTSENIKKLLPKGADFALTVRHKGHVSFYTNYSCYSQLAFHLTMITGDLIEQPCPHDCKHEEQPVNHRINN